MKAKEGIECQQTAPFSRRNILLGNTTLAAATAISASAPITVARAQAQPAPSGRKPTSCAMADDIGWFNVSIYNHGIMGYRI
jgi:arylsulfatase